MPSAATKVLVINGHPDPSPDRFCAALAGAYAEGASQSGRSVRRLAIGALTFPVLRTAVDFSGPVHDEAKAFLEQVLRYGFALDADHKRLRGRLKGRSVRLIVTMGMPALAYRLVFGGPGLKALMPVALFMAGFWPICMLLIGGIGAASPNRRRRWLAHVRRLGVRGR